MNHAPTNEASHDSRGAMAEPISPSRRIVFWAIILLFMALTIEAISAGAIWLIPRFISNDFFWNPDLDVVRSRWSASPPVAGLDDELGWLYLPLANNQYLDTHDPGGAKKNVDFPESSAACVSAYGDSLIWGDDVPLADGWIEQLSRRLGCRVANYGVPGGSTDHAYVRFQHMPQDKAPVVVLGIFTDNVERNVNQYRALMWGWVAASPYVLKGRFVLDQAGELQWIARPRLDADEFLKMHQNPKVFLPHEYLLPDSRDGPVTPRFPYTVALARVVMRDGPKALRYWLQGVPKWSEFWHPDHPSGAVPLTIAIARAFAKEAEQRGTKPFIVMLPAPASLHARDLTGETEYAPFVAAMKSGGLDVFDIAPALAEALKGRNRCEFYAMNCGHHFSVTGGAVVAEIVANELRRRNLVQ